MDKAKVGWSDPPTLPPFHRLLHLLVAADESEEEEEEEALRETCFTSYRFNYTFSHGMTSRKSRRDSGREKISGYGIE